ncbi:hypothetical protein GQ44DRAFT_816956 [Phaeosphaeriaceae sp. PMI808]|nr:hypothetical protein GQ44DRAFT_816956 [Phaeosphaeriaceae sp. PMI808]
MSINIALVTSDLSAPYKEHGFRITMTQHTIHPNIVERVEGCVDDKHVTQGRVLWLPAKEDLPERAVRRAHGKGAIEEGIYNHPVVVISRSINESHSIHFHLITSLQGRRLDQLYSKSNEFHASRRSWYLPIAPAPDHPDALSKKARKRFPTLKLANGAILRWDSYVNIRHVYKIDLSLLRPYSNPETPDTVFYGFEGESMVRMLAKGKTLTMYEPGSQFVGHNLTRSASEPVYRPTNGEDIIIDHMGRPGSPASGPGISTTTSHPHSKDFHLVDSDTDRIVGPPPKVPPDGEKQSNNILFVLDGILRPLDYFLGSIKSLAVAANETPTEMKLKPISITQPLNRPGEI